MKLFIEIATIWGGVMTRCYFPNTATSSFINLDKNGLKSLNKSVKKNPVKYPKNGIAYANCKIWVGLFQLFVCLFFSGLRLANIL